MTKIITGNKTEWTSSLARTRATVPSSLDLKYRPCLVKLLVLSRNSPQIFFIIRIDKAEQSFFLGSLRESKEIREEFYADVSQTVLID